MLLHKEKTSLKGIQQPSIWHDIIQMLNVVSFKLKIYWSAPGHLVAIWEMWIYSVWFHFYKFQKQAEWIKSVTNQERLPLEDRVEAGGQGQMSGILIILFHNLHVGYGCVCFVKICWALHFIFLLYYTFLIEV